MLRHSNAQATKFIVMNVKFSCMARCTNGKGFIDEELLAYIYQRRYVSQADSFQDAADFAFTKIS